MNTTERQSKLIKIINEGKYNHRELRLCECGERFITYSQQDFCWDCREKERFRTR